MSDTITQFGITWTFDQDYPTGQFANWDWWVVGPVSIIGIEPRCQTINGRTMNGSMVNPKGGWWLPQGYDSGMPDNRYDLALNIARDVSLSKPLLLEPGSSLVSTISLPAPGKTTLQRAAVLTVLDKEPTVGSFRPPYCGTDKAVRFNMSQLRRDLLRRLPAVPNTPDIQNVAKWFEAPWLDHITGWIGDQAHPRDNMPDYGREIHGRIGMAALMLHLDFAPEQKETLLVRFIQLGIDLYGVAQNGGYWPGAGGHGGGRKWPILFAGIMLDDPGMKGIGAKSGAHLYENGYGAGKVPPDYIRFGEDDQTFYVAQVDVGATNSPRWRPDSRDTTRLPYQTADLGLPEWGIEHANDPYQSNGAIWTMYRNVACVPFHSTALAALLTPSGKELWNHSAYFDYTDRYMALTAKGGPLDGWWSEHGSFTRNMWETYRGNLPQPEPQPEPIPPVPPQPEPPVSPEPEPPSPPEPEPTKTCLSCTHGKVCRLREQAVDLVADLQDLIGDGFGVGPEGVTEIEIYQLEQREREAALLGQRLAAELAAICPLYERIPESAKG